MALAAQLDAGAFAGGIRHVLLDFLQRHAIDQRTLGRALGEAIGHAQAIHRAR